MLGRSLGTQRAGGGEIIRNLAESFAMRERRKERKKKKIAQPTFDMQNNTGGLLSKLQGAAPAKLTVTCDRWESLQAIQFVRYFLSLFFSPGHR